MYAPLWVKSNFSFQQGASHPEELIDQAQALGLPALALTDLDGVHGIVRAHTRATELGLKLIFGSELTLARELGDGLQEGSEWRVVLLCQSRLGYGNLCQLISRGRGRSPKGSSALQVSELCELSEGLIALCPQPRLLGPLQGAFGDRLYALLTRHLLAEEDPHEQALRRAAEACGVQTLASTEVLYHQASRKPLQDVLSCIAVGKSLAGAGRVIRQNAEHDLKSARSMRDLFADDPASLRRSMQVVERCQFSLDALRYRYPGEKLPDGKSESDWLRELTLQGAAGRFPRGVPVAVSEQIDRELLLIGELEYGGYFLTMWEIVRFCRSSGILCQGAAVRPIASSAFVLASRRWIRSSSTCSLSASSVVSVPSRRTSIWTSSTSAARRSSSGSTSATAGVTPRWSPTSSAIDCARPCATSARCSAFP